MAVYNGFFLVLDLGVSLRAEAGAGGRAGHAQAGLWSSAGVLAGVGQSSWAQSHWASRFPQRCSPGARGLSGWGLAWVLLKGPMKVLISSILFSAADTWSSFCGYFTFFTWLAVLIDMEVGSRLALRLLFKLFMISRFLAFSASRQRSHSRIIKRVIKLLWSNIFNTLQLLSQQQHLSPDSASLSDSLSSSELELLEAFPWLWDWLCPVWPSSSSSSAGLLGRAGGGCFSRSWRHIFSLLLIREIEVLQGRGRGGVEQQVACRGGWSVRALIPCAAN